MKLPRPFLRFALIILIVTMADGLWVWFSPHPLPGAAIIPATIPVWVSLFVIYPMMREAKRHKHPLT